MTDSHPCVAEDGSCATHGVTRCQHRIQCGWLLSGNPDRCPDGHDQRSPKTEPMPPPHVKVWPFYEAPMELRRLSPHGGDEDWLALVPASLADTYMGWMNPGSSFGVCDVSEHVLPNGDVVRIGAHS